MGYWQQSYREPSGIMTDLKPNELTVRCSVSGKKKNNTAKTNMQPVLEHITMNIFHRDAGDVFSVLFSLKWL